MDHKDRGTTLPGGGMTTFGGGTGGGMAISGGGTPNTGGGTAFWPVPAEFNHCHYNKCYVQRTVMK